MNDKHIVIITTPVSSKTFTQVTCLMSDDELDEARRERPDLEFRIASHEPQEPLPVISEEQGITVRGMTLPHNLDYLVNQLFEKDVSKQH